MAHGRPQAVLLSIGHCADSVVTVLAVNARLCGFLLQRHVSSLSWLQSPASGISHNHHHYPKLALRYICTVFRIFTVWRRSSLRILNYSSNIVTLMLVNALRFIRVTVSSLLSCMLSPSSVLDNVNTSTHLMHFRLQPP